MLSYLAEDLREQDLGVRKAPGNDYFVLLLLAVFLYQADVTESFPSANTTKQCIVVWPVSKLGFHRRGV
ncbi:MAG: hypothetical protein CVU38_01950 [Chloroflexi bacterium HGW-Chloroflexi-1]|nr:MAG: hypothetical protein CVU38_01950 [Chloroflexi bacterium HGW-Chloroflexi-1]